MDLMDPILAATLGTFLKDTFLIGSTFVVLFGLIWWWGWIMKSFGTF